MSEPVGVNVSMHRVVGRVEYGPYEPWMQPMVRITENGHCMHSVQCVQALATNDLVELVNGLWWLIEKGNSDQ
jgi:hypothetical protein